MKAFYILILSLITLSTYGQTVMVIHRSTGADIQVPLSEIDSITYTTFSIPTEPVIQSISVNQTPTSGGTNIRFTIIAASASPVDWINSSFYGPTGNIYGGGSGVFFDELSTGIWSYSRTDFVSEWAPSGTYYYENVSVENEAELISDVWPDSVRLTIINPEVAVQPVINDIQVSQAPVSGGTELTFVITATSNAPVDWFNSSFYGPNGNIFGGGSGVFFNEIATDTWEYTFTQFISEWSPSGTYYLENISVENAGELVSDVWPDSVRTTISNAQVATTPVITDVTVNTTPVSGGTNVSFKVTATSNAPVDWLNSSFFGPAGNIYGGGSGVSFTETSPGVWEYTRTDFVSEFAPAGTYSYQNISVENAGDLRSLDWPNLVEFTIP